ncbi:ATP-binding cassette domain-containing protein [Streptomyces sp. ICN988]|uniref:ABC transporter ATP-binding protein n=1 Tax=Streptomyces sp. ICN988 TaxID=2983765 RepID=UPI0021E3D169|nr:ATP-binding cassette domain-containing protein [Streptomyces sp. ICN988]MCV2458428.1 ATP-binding cassette domain-containing protein [Streptomyces sp. ICN988]
MSTLRYTSLIGRIHKLRDREEWKFFAVLPRASAGLSWAWWALIVTRGFLPALVTVSMAALVSAVDEDGALLGPLIAVGTVLVTIQLLSPLHAEVSANLGDRLSCWLHDRLIVATTEPAGVRHLESKELTDQLTIARDFDLGIAGPPMNLTMGFVAGSLVEMAAGLGQAALLAGYAWWAPLLVGGAWAATHWLLRESSIWDRDTGEVLDAQRRADYTYRLAVEASAAKEVRLFGLSEWTVAQFAANRRRLVDLHWRETRLRQRPLGWAVALLVVANGVMLWSLARDAVSGALGIGQVLMFAQATIGTCALAFGGLNWALPPAASSVATVLALGPRMAKQGALNSGSLKAEGFPRAHIRFRKVGFTYPEGGRRVLDGLDLEIPAGTSLAIVGRNGAGKTTLAKLICGLYEPTDGAVEVDEADLRSVDPKSWRRRVTAVFQDFVRYELPLKFNVAPLGADDEVVVAALADAGAGDLVDLDTVLSRGYDGGTDLSGGQWQRVAVARALCAVRQGARVVILDEPTAQMDVRGEAEIFERLLRKTRGCTTLLISHRFSTVQHADRICVLEDGKVLELGTHDELMALGGRYREMFDLQASRFVQEETNAAVE